MPKFSSPSVILPIPLFPTADQSPMFFEWGSHIRRLHVATRLLMLGYLMEHPLTMADCWAAVEAGELPSGLILPDPDAAFLIPDCHGPGRRVLTSERLAEDVWSVARHYPLPNYASRVVARHVYASAKKVKGGSRGTTELGQRPFREVLRFPSPLSPVAIPVDSVLQERALTLTVPDSWGNQHVIPAATFLLPSTQPFPEHTFRGEIQYRDGAWALWAQLPIETHLPSPAGDLVGVDPGMRYWLTCVDRHGAFHLPAPSDRLAPPESPLPLAQKRFEAMREVLEQTLWWLLSYRRVALENLDPGHLQRVNEPDAQAFFRDTGLGVLREWLSGLSNGHGGTEVRFTPSYASSTRCPQCNERGRSEGQLFRCGHPSCGYVGPRDEASARMHARRFAEGLVRRQDVFQFLPMTTSASMSAELPSIKERIR